jgi:hypothetical protein
MIANGDILQTIAEIGAAFAGFAALVTAIGLRAGHERSVDLTRLHIAVGGSIMVVVGGVLPLAVGAYSPEHHLVWRISAGFVLALNYAYIVVYMPWVRRLRQGAAEPSTVQWFFWLLEAGFQVPLIVLLIGLATGFEAALYLTGITVLLFQAAVVFLGLVTSVASALASE